MHDLSVSRSASRKDTLPPLFLLLSSLAPCNPHRMQSMQCYVYNAMTSQGNTSKFKVDSPAQYEDGKHQDGTNPSHNFVN